MVKIFKLSGQSSFLFQQRFSKVTTNVQRKWEAMSNCLRIVSVQFLGSPARCLHCQIAYVPVPAAAEREMSNSFAGNLDNVPGNKSVHIRRSWMRTFEQFKQIGIHWHWPVVKRWKSLTNGSRFNRTVFPSIAFVDMHFSLIVVPAFNQFDSNVSNWG